MEFALLAVIILGLFLAIILNAKSHDHTKG